MLVALLACTGTQAQQDPLPEGRVDLQLSVEQSHGRYGEASRTRIRNLVWTTRYRRGPWLAEVQVPWLEVRSPGGGGLPETVGSGGSVERGAGDILFKFGAELREMDTGQTGLDLVVKWKTRSGSLDRGLGTGGTDLSLQMEVAHPIGGRRQRQAQVGGPRRLEPLARRQRFERLAQQAAQLVGRRGTLPAPPDQHCDDSAHWW